MEKETENNIESPSTSNDPKVEESPKPLAFTIDFGEGKSVDTQRHKALVEKYQNRHRRGQSLSKIDEPSTQKKNGNVSSSTRKSEGYYSSDERGEKIRSSRTFPHSTNKSKGDLTLPLKNILNDKMTQSFPNVKFNLSTIRSPDIELKDISSPELDPVSPFSPKAKPVLKQMSSPNPVVERVKITRQHSSPECKLQQNPSSSEFVDATEFDFDKSDSVSDAGTYTVDNDNYTEEQKARMSIDKEFNIEQISVLKKTEEYVRNLATMNDSSGRNNRPLKLDVEPIAAKLHINKNMDRLLPSPKSPGIPTSPLASNQSYKTFIYKNCTENREPKTKLSPILSPTQNLSITEGKVDVGIENTDPDDALNQTFTKIMFPSPKSKTGIGFVDGMADQGSFTSVTSSGAFSRKGETQLKGHHRQPSLTKSEIHVETYTSSNSRGQPGDNVIHATISVNHKESISNNNILDNKVPNISKDQENDDYDLLNATLTLAKVNNLPPAIGGKTSPTKIPSPIHTARPRSRNSISSANVDLSDSSLETESYLKPTQSIINSLQKKLSLDSDQESDFDTKCNFRLNNNTRNLMKQKSKHTRHNSFDDRNLTISNKLEHFQNKNLQSIDQTFGNKLQNRTVIKVQNSPNNSPLRRSSSFSNKNKVPAAQPKVSNLTKDINLIKNSPSLTRNSNSIQRSASTANIRPNILQSRRSSAESEHERIDRSQFGDTESSSEEDFDKNLLKKKDLTNLTNTRYNRAFSLRRARLETEPTPSQKCPNTPEMRRKFQSNDHLRMERAISVDRRPVKTNDVQSRYLQNITRNKSATPPKIEITKNVPKYQHNVNKPQVFARTDSGRFSMRSTKSAVTGYPKNQRKDSTSKKQSGGRSNSTLSSREVEFQNWKRRKSYDPMKAAAEGKKKAEMAKKHVQNIMVQSYIESNQDCDSSPSHSSSVHRSQSFHGTAALEQLISSEDEDLTLSADEGFSPPTPSPCELSPARARLREAWKDKILH